MNWDDKGFLLSKHRYNENSLIAEIFTKDHGKISGIIFGGTSKKIKNYLQIGNQLFVNLMTSEVHLLLIRLVFLFEFLQCKFFVILFLLL